MRAYLLTALLVIDALSSLGQYAKIVPNNPGPRQGEELEITIVLDDEDLEHLKDNMELKSKNYSRLLQNNYALGSLKIKELPTDTGKFIIGPFQLNVNGKLYKAEEITLNIDRKLPDDKRDGIWIRHIRLNNWNYLVIEQRLTIRKEYEMNELPNPLGNVNNDIAFAEPKIAKMSTSGIETLSNLPTSTIQRVSKSIKGPLDGFVHFRRTVLKFNLTTDVPVRVTKDLFRDIPPDTFFQEIVVKNFHGGR